jgi:hypothetical protein
MIKIIFFTFLAILWSMFECIYLIFTQKVSPIGMWIAENLNNDKDI